MDGNPIGLDAFSVLPPKLQEKYRVLKKLGSGVYGKVYECELKELQGAKFAIKKIRVSSSKIKGIFGMDQNIVRELNLLRTLNHVNILRLHAFHFEMLLTSEHQGDTKNMYKPAFYLIFELCDCDISLLISKQYEQFVSFWKNSVIIPAENSGVSEDRILERLKLHPQCVPLPGMKEEDLKVILYQLIQALAYCHARGILHRDLKPQNIMIQKEGQRNGRDIWVVKLGDFGLASGMYGDSEGRQKTEEVVTLLYRCPELLMGHLEYNSEVDIWAVGVIASEMVLGRPPFKCKTEFELLVLIFLLLGKPSKEEIVLMSPSPDFFENILPATEVDRMANLREFFTDIYGRNLLSNLALDFLNQLFCFHPRKRPTAVQALRHPWFNNIGKYITNLDVYIQSNTLLPPHFLASNPEANTLDEDNCVNPSLPINKF